MAMMINPHSLFVKEDHSMVGATEPEEGEWYWEEEEAAPA